MLIFGTEMDLKRNVKNSIEKKVILVPSMVTSGEQHIYTDEGQKIIVKAGQNR